MIKSDKINNSSLKLGMKKLYTERMGHLFKSFGPAWLVMIADVDVASIITGLQSGASWGYHMIFIIIILIFPLFIIQYAAGRLGIASFGGLGVQIRTYFGKRAAIFAAIPMGISDFLEYVAEYAGIAIGLRLLGFPVIIGLLIAFITHTLIIVSRQYKKAQKWLIPVSFLLVAVLVGVMFIFPINWHSFVTQGLSPIQPYLNPSYTFLLAASVGAVIMPWMLYYHSGADSRLKKQITDLKNERRETLVGSIISEVLMVIIIIVGMDVFKGTGLLNLNDLPKILPNFGSFTVPFIGICFIAAGFLALVVISLGSAWGILEAVGSSTDSRKSFLTIYIIESLPAVILVATITGYIQLMLNLMFVFPIILIPSLYFLGKLVSRRDVMHGHNLSRREMIIFWIAAFTIIGCGILGLTSL